MAFSSAITARPFSMGNKRVSTGTFDCASVATGNIDTGLRVCEQIILQQVAAAVVADAPTVEETLPVAGSAITIHTTASAAGNWIAIGY